MPTPDGVTRRASPPPSPAAPGTAALPVPRGSGAAAGPPFDYDLIVIGSGPGGQKAAIAAAKLGRRVCVIERPAMVGGVCINTATIP